MYDKYFVELQCEVTLILISFKYCVVVCLVLFLSVYHVPVTVPDLKY